MNVHCPSAPAVFVAALAHEAATVRFVVVWTKYCAPGLPPKVTVTVPSRLSRIPRTLGTGLAIGDPLLLVKWLSYDIGGKVGPDMGLIALNNFIQLRDSPIPLRMN